MEKQRSAAGMRIGDCIVILAVFVLAAAVFFIRLPHSSSSAAFVRVETEEGTALYPLDTPREISVRSAGHSLTVSISNGKVQVTASDCPSGICTASGEISAPGQSIVCMPGRVLIEIVSDGGATSDDKIFILP